MKKWNNYVFILLSVIVFCCAAAPGFAQDVQTEAETVQEVQTAVETPLEGQLTLEDLQALNGGDEKVFVHDGRVTFVDGTCTADPVTNEEEAAAVVVSMTELLGGDIRTQFIPWRELKDPNGNTYFVFQQMYAGTTVLGGAVKVITDGDGKMIALSSSIVSELPEEEESVGITAEEAEQIVLAHEEEAGHSGLNVIDGFTDKIILPNLLDVTIEEGDATSRFVWVVYTNNPERSADKVEHLPYLAHYVGMDGTYLYSLATIMPGDSVGSTGFNNEYVFEFMEPVEYTGYVDYSDGSEKELTVTVMRDTRTGMYYLGNIDRRIVVADCYEYLYNNGKVRLVSSPDNREWDQVALISFYNYCRAYDYYKEIGWIGGDGLKRPILILNNYCDENHIPVDNAAFVGNLFGWSIFVSSRSNDFAQGLDVIAHEFTHCVTDAVMTYNAYTNDFGAINEAMSDIQGEISEQMFDDPAEKWVIADNTLTPMRSLSDPHKYGQPEYSWDLYYIPPVQTATAINDNGGVHTNSSLLNNLAYRLIANGGMTLEEARAFWFAVDCTMVPGTDYAQLSEILPWVLKAQGMEKYSTALQAAIDATRIGITEIPDFFDDDRALIVLELPETEVFTDSNWALQIQSVDIYGFWDTAVQIYNQIQNKDYSNMPETVSKLFSENQEPEAAPTPEPEGDKSFWDLIGSMLSAVTEAAKEAQAEPTPEPTPDPETEAALNDFLAWLQQQFVDYFYNAMVGAGTDGHTIRIMGRPGRTIPMLMHLVLDENSQIPKQVVLAICVNNHWYDMTPKPNPEQDGESTDGKQAASIASDQLLQDIVPQIIEAVFSGKSLDEILDIITLEIKGGEVNMIPTAGLEDIVLPDPSAESELFNLAGLTEEIPARMSRPKETKE